MAGAAVKCGERWAAHAHKGHAAKKVAADLNFAREQRSSAPVWQTDRHGRAKRHRARAPRAPAEVARLRPRFAPYPAIVVLVDEVARVAVP